MDDKNGEFMERAELTGVGRSECKTERQVVEEKQRIDFRDKVRHNEKTDQLFVKTTMKVDGRDEEQVLW